MKNETATNPSGGFQTDDLKENFWNLAGDKENKQRCFHLKVDS